MFKGFTTEGCKTGLIAFFGFLLLLVTAPLASASGFAPGDLIVSLSDGTIEIRSATDGTLKSTMSGPFTGEAKGLAFDANGNLMATYWYNSNDTNGNTVAIYHPDGSYSGTFGSGYNCQPSGLIRDSKGNFWVADAGCTGQLLKFDSTGTLLQALTLPSDNVGVWWMDFAPDGCTLYYTSDGEDIQRYNVCNNTALPNFNTAPLSTSGAGALGLRLLQDGSVLVADHNDIIRLDPSGNVAMTYDAVNDWGLVDVYPDSDGKTFWASSYGTGTVYHYDMATGAVLLSFATPALAKGVIVVPTPPPPAAPCGCDIKNVNITTSWNSIEGPKGSQPKVWLNAHISTPAGLSTTATSEVLFTNGTLTVNGAKYPMPDGMVIFSPKAIIPFTVYDEKLNMWITTVNPNKMSDEIFFDGAAIPATPAMASSGTATLSFTVQSKVNLSFDWQWSASVFSSWPNDWNAAAILPCHGSGHAGSAGDWDTAKSLIEEPRGVNGAIAASRSVNVNCRP